MLFIKKILILFGAFAIVGCATVTGGGNSQAVSVATVDEYGKDVSGAACNVNNDKGNWKLTSPGQVTITKSDKAILVRCEKAPSAPGVATVESTVRGAMFGNIIAGGLIGAAVDHSSGAAYEYPEMIKVILGISTGYKIQYDQRSNADKTAIVRLMPPPTGYAAIGDVSAMPRQEANNLKLYNDYMNHKGPKAFAVSQDLSVGWAGGLLSSNGADQRSRDPGERALSNCRQRAKTPCVLYAVDEQVVYVKPNFALASSALSSQTTTGLATTPVANQLIGAQATLLSGQPQAPAMMATGFANINDTDAIPFISDKCREQHREWLTKPTPRAFVISDKGFCSVTWGINPQNAEEPKDPSERALQRCAKANNAPCKLYALNGSVVYVKDMPAASSASTVPAESKPAAK